MTIKQAISNKNIRRALNALAGCPEGGWPQTQQALRLIQDEIPHRHDRNWSMFDLINQTLIVDSTGRYTWR